LPYVDSAPRDGRQIVMRGFYEHESGEWIMHVPHDDGLIRIQGAEAFRATYYSRAPADPSRDLILPLSTVTSMNLSFPGVHGPVSAIESDLHHFCSLLETYRILTAHPPQNGLADLLLAQFEALVLLIRQVFDHLQRVARQLCKTVHDLETQTNRLIHDLPTSFANVVLHGDDLRSSAEIAKQFRLPEPISLFYEGHAARFKALRDLRVSIEHHGVTPDTIFLLEQGAAVIAADNPWAALGPWPATLSHDKFISLRGVIAHLIDYTLGMLHEFAAAFTAQIAVPPALSRGVQVFLRNPHGEHLVRIPAVLDEPWERIAEAPSN
jgi:hypothetical protein